MILLLACAPSPDAYAVGVESIVEEVLVRARDRAWPHGCYDAPPDPAALADRVAGDHPIVPAPGFGSDDDAPWTGRVEVALTATDDPLAWNLGMKWNDVRVRRLGAQGWDPPCEDWLWGEGCAIDWDPVDYTFAGALSGTLQVEVTGREASCEGEGPLYRLSADVEGAVGPMVGNLGAEVDLHVWSERAEYWGGGGATGTVADTPVDFSWEWSD